MDAASSDVVDVGSDAKSDEVLMPSVLVITKGFGGGSSEKDFMPCARLSYHGSRTVVAVSFLDLLAFMRAEGVKDLKSHNVWAFLQRASHGVLTKLYKAAKVFHAS